MVRNRICLGAAAAALAVLLAGCDTTGVYYPGYGYYGGYPSYYGGYPYYGGV